MCPDAHATKTRHRAACRGAGCLFVHRAMAFRGWGLFMSRKEKRSAGISPSVRPRGSDSPRCSRSRRVKDVSHEYQPNGARKMSAMDPSESWAPTKGKTVGRSLPASRQNEKNPSRGRRLLMVSSVHHRVLRGKCQRIEPGGSGILLLVALLGMVLIVVRDAPV